MFTDFFFVMKTTINVLQDLIRYYMDENQLISMPVSLTGTCWGPGFITMIKTVGGSVRWTDVSTRDPQTLFWIFIKIYVIWIVYILT